MTISSEVRKAGPFAGNGITTSFPFTFKVFSDEDLLVVIANAAGVELILDLGTDYTVTLNPDQNASPGGSAVLAQPPAAGEKLVLTTQVGNLQPVDLTNSGGFYPAVINTALDRLTILIQQLREQASRSLKVSITSSEEATPDALIAEMAAAVGSVAASAAAASGSATAAAGSATAAAGSATAAADSAALAGAAILNFVDSSGLGAHRNKLINGDFSQNVRALTSVADDTYCLDRWYVLTETGNVTVAQLTDPESGAPFGIRLTQPDASPKRMGFAQITESKNIRQYASRAMHLAARLRLSTGAAIRYAVIEHTGTADVVTSDVVNNWASATFTPSNFFIAGLNVLSTGTITPGAATWGEVSAWAALSAGVKNVIVFVWTESQVAQNVTLDCSRIQYEPGVVATPHEWRLNERSLCDRYAVPMPLHISMQVYSASAAFGTWSTPVPMRSVPSLSGGSYQLHGATGNLLPCTLAVASMVGAAIRFEASGSSSLVAGNATMSNSPAGAYLSSEL